ncbi:39S ribosomal protein L16, mitochondrial [Coemansia spiralis]|uniref:39S ribosomal protein L16, mitochondrial n=2 Tax=Coemansia TaxID=4863 RepID=A0A9W8KZI5_9FUNG|nr:ribosomal protein L16p/L10e-domain-containing protein [Coemansia spiralis]KAJ1989579.1 39S ribosomal protein L16, mitochondrial [Coemansia umbellata]KAJ2625705.1 39S ribosomal protein L16, mitochondrial [Coemansia sp. RSA 1358]KAJ2678523.1 39S ribosomal protein L16, mitochondrial [Coemansia spiralis]
MWAAKFARNLLFRTQIATGISAIARAPVIQQKAASVFSTPAVRTTQVRSLSNLQPRRRKFKKAQKGRVPVRTGGSTKGNYMAFGDYGLRVKAGVRLSANTISAIHTMLRRKLKAIKDLKIWLRVFPDIPVTTKGTEVRMGKGKGAFDYWACRVPKDKIIFEMRGNGLNIELAKDAMRQASFKLGVPSEFVVTDEKTKQPKKEDLPPTTIPFQQAK